MAQTLIDSDVFNLIITIMQSPISQGTGITWGTLATIIMVMFAISVIWGK